YGLGMTTIFCLHGAVLPADTIRWPEKVIELLACGEAVMDVLERAVAFEPSHRFADARSICAALWEAAIRDRNGHSRSTIADSSRGAEEARAEDENKTDWLDHHQQEIARLRAELARRLEEARDEEKKMTGWLENQQQEIEWLRAELDKRPKV